MRQRRIVAALCITVVPLVAACGAGSGSEQDKERATPYVGSGKLGTLHVGGARLVTATGSSAQPSSAGSSPAQAYLTLTLVNNGDHPQTLSNATVAGGGTVQPTSPNTAALTVAPSSILRFGDPDAGDTQPALAVSGFAPVAGTAVSVTLTFGQAGSLSITVPIVDLADSGTTSPTYQPLITGGYPSPTVTGTP